MNALTNAALSITFLDSVTRDEALWAIIRSAVVPRGPDPEEVFRVVLEREASLSSRVSDSIAMPHAIMNELRETRLAFGVCPPGIDWDGREEPVRLVVLLVGPEERHLPIMSSISRLLQAPGILEAIIAAKTEAEVRRLLSGGNEMVAPVAARTLTVTAATVNHAAELASALPEDPIVVATANPGIYRLLGPLLEEPLSHRTYLVGPGLSEVVGTDEWKVQDTGVTVLSTDRFPEDRHGPATLALLPLLTSGVVRSGSEVILLTGRVDHGGLDAVRLVDVSRELQIPEGLTDSQLPHGVRLEVVIRALHLTAELGFQGREGKPVGTIIVIGDDPKLEKLTQQMILNPFSGYAATDRNILDPSLSETVKELAKIDGAFLVSGDGTLLSVGVHLAGQPDPREMEAGLGARHAAALGITASADVMAICLSESTGTITLFHKGRRLIRR